MRFCLQAEILRPTLTLLLIDYRICSNKSNSIRMLRPIQGVTGGTDQTSGVFLRSNYTDITQNTYIQSWMVTEILATEKSGLLWCLHTVFVILPAYLNWIPMLSLDAAPATLTTGKPLRAYSGWKSMDNYDTCASVFVVLFTGFMSLTIYFDVMYRH